MCTRVFNTPKLLYDKDGKYDKVDYKIKIKNTHLVTGRNMDWPYPMDINIYHFKRGIDKIGFALDKANKWDAIPEQWTSKYDSICTYLKDEAACDGMNTEGLVANILYLSESIYAKDEELKGKICLNVMAWVQYVVDMFSNVEEVCEAFKDNEITMVGALVPTSVGEPPKPAKVHLSVSDKLGQSAILEVINGKIRINKSPEFRVMTNSPVYPQQIVVNQYWRYEWNKNNPSPSYTLPGTTSAPDRFARASYFINNTIRFTTEHEAIVQMSSLMQAVAVPLGLRDIINGGDQISQTRYSSVFTHKSLCYFFRATTDYSFFGIPMEIFNGASFQGLKLKKHYMNTEAMEESKKDKRIYNLDNGFNEYSGKLTFDDFEPVENIPFSIDYKMEESDSLMMEEDNNIS
ncbi:MAG: linear amide C-N hydrolase [Hyphomicrobiales bacterium]